jgi:putative N6-adenine-specific DNA methylase
VKLSLFAATAPGLEHFVHAEALALDLAQTAIVPGGVEITTEERGAVRLLLSLRTASHLLARVAKFRADRFDRFEREVKKIDWCAWLAPGAPRRVRATAERSRLYHTNAIVERLERFLDDAIGAADPGSSVAPVPIAARFVKDTCTLSIDLSGEPLHRRGYRLDPGRAPLRDDLAAALVMASGWDGARPLVDPFCGSGTIAIEAAMVAARIAPGLTRPFAMEGTRLGSAALFTEERALARERITAPVAAIVAADRDPRAIARTRENAERAGVLPFLSVIHAPLSELDLGGLTRPAIVTNPPWGERIDEGPGLERLYAALGALVRRLGPGATLAFAAHDRDLARRVGMPVTSAFLTDAGGMKLSAMVSSDGGS